MLSAEKFVGLHDGHLFCIVELDEESLADVAFDLFVEVGSNFLVVREDDDLIEIEIRQRLERARAILRIRITERGVNDERNAALGDFRERE